MDQEISTLLSEAESGIGTAIRFLAFARQNAEGGFVVVGRHHVFDALNCLVQSVKQLKTAYDKLGSAESSPEATHRNTTAASTPSTANSNSGELEELEG